MQASGGRRSEFLEKLAEFQHRESELGRPVARVVTSRTVVADQLRYPEGVTVLRLEPFDTHRIGTWLDSWNDLNAGYFQRTGLEPLSTDDLAAHQDLAREPLLLLMLALYDATENALPRHSETFRQTDLPGCFTSSCPARSQAPGIVIAVPCGNHQLLVLDGTAGGGGIRDAQPRPAVRDQG